MLMHVWMTTGSTFLMTKDAYLILYVLVIMACSRYILTVLSHSLL